MDRHCNNCIYKYFEENDIRNTWGFCMCDKIPRNKQINVKKKMIYSEDYPAFELSKIPKDCIPSCMLVQSFYEGHCPFKTE